MTIQYTEGGEYVTATVPIPVTKSTGSISLDPTTVTLNADTPSATVQITATGDGAITAQSGNASLVSAEVASNILTVTSLGTTEETVTVTVTMAETDAYTGASASLTVRNYITTQVFGVSWDTTDPSTQLTRLTSTTDPNGYVNTDITTAPSPAVGTGAGSSPFDQYAPWNGMYVCNLGTDGVETAKQGDPTFSYSTADVMVYIPQFYYHIEESGNNRLFYISDMEMDGFELHPGSGKYVARYDTSAGYASVTGTAPLVNITRATARTQSRAKGTGWGEYDFMSWCAVWLLYLVEFADWNSQAVIGAGITGANAAQNNGGTDSMTHHTGRADGTDDLSAVQYRGVENPWGNVFEWIDGINFNGRAAYICTNPANYADDTSSNYTDTGVTLPSRGYIMGLGVSAAFPWAFLPNASGGSDTTYIPDTVSSDSGWRVFRAGGTYSGDSAAGLFSFVGNNNSSGFAVTGGARLLYRP